jgi:hypothetical protein
MQKVSTVCTNYYMRRNPGAKSNTITILAAIASSLALAQAAPCQPSGKDGLGLDEGMVLRENDLKAREDIKDIIMRPIWQRFGLRKLKVEIDEGVVECRKAFDIVCSFIRTRDLVQEHIAFRVWPLVEKWEMPKETISKSDEGGLVRLKYTFRYEGKFVEPDDDWLKCIEATSDKLLGPYSKAEDNALSAAFGGRKKKRLNRVFDAIGFMYPDYRYPSQGQKRKSAISGKDAAPAAPSEPAPKRKKVKVLTHRSRYIEPAEVPEFGGETSSTTKAEESALTQRNEEPATMPKASPAKSGEPKAINIEEAEVEKTKNIRSYKPSAEVTVSKAQKDLTTTPKRKRMVNVLDVLERIKTSSSTPGKTAEASKTRIETKQTEAAQSHAETEAGPSEPAKEKSLEIGEEKAEKESAEQIMSEKTAIPIPEVSSEALDYIVRHASGKRLSAEEKREAQYYAQRLKYPKGTLIFNGSGEEDFLYCLPDSKEICLPGDGQKLRIPDARRRALSAIKR